MIAQSIKDFAEQNIRPYIMEWDEAQIFPKELFKKLGAMGFMGVLVPEELGGSGLGYHEYITIIEEISKVDPSIGLSIAAHNSLCTNHILTFGTEEQKKRWIPKLASGEHIGDEPTGWPQVSDSRRVTQPRELRHQPQSGTKGKLPPLSAKSDDARRSGLL